MNSKRLILSILTILVTACEPGPTAAPSDAPKATAASPGGGSASTALTDIPLPAGRGVRGGWFELYFTDPTSPLASQLTGGVDGPLAAAIDSARLRVDVAAYSLSLNSIRDALLRAHDRGVQVRIVMESDNRERSDAQILIDAGIVLLGDRREGLMHNKFIVIDGSEVWLGSMNFTDSGAYRDNNGLMRIRSAGMAEDYAREFEEMFLEDKFGAEAGLATPRPRVTIEGTPIDVYFSPDDGAQAGLLELVEHAAESIHFLAFSFTADPLGEAIRLRALDGVRVAGVMDSDQVDSNIGTEFDPFNQAGLEVLRDGIPGQMHHKTLIIDREIVVFGSYNFTNSAETRNDENLLVIYNRGIAARFLDEFERILGAAKAPLGDSFTTLPSTDPPERTFLSFPDP
jgi:phosphatidylserine/phosphatidylglycerophosphate/cardiolipin synthase-like enzyme